MKYKIYAISSLGTWAFFIPPGVALMLYFDIIKAQIIPIALATLISTILVLVVTG